MYIVLEPISIEPSFIVLFILKYKSYFLIMEMNYILSTKYYIYKIDMFHAYSLPLLISNLQLHSKCIYTWTRLGQVHVPLHENCQEHY